MALKRTFDIVASLILLIVVAPLFVVIAVLIKVTMPGPVFYKGTRIGRFGRPFRMWKFRSMVVDADRLGASSTAGDDPRLTAFGSWMRRYKIDELPQLVNVLLGDMSLVGPRPQVEWAVARYSEEERLVLSVRPGVTDLASLRFANEAEILQGSTDPDRDYLERIHPEKMRLALQYVRTRSFAGDLAILARTAGAALHLT
jgi:lipopolysaccharide/colanic/teichoic acid biosynthesis glycosyltransferase